MADLYRKHPTVARQAEGGYGDPWLLHTVASNFVDPESGNLVINLTFVYSSDLVPSILASDAARREATS